LLGRFVVHLLSESTGLLSALPPVLRRPLRSRAAFLIFKYRGMQKAIPAQPFAARRLDRATPR
jgi:hypothetical protein